MPSAEYMRNYRARKRAEEEADQLETNRAFADQVNLQFARYENRIAELELEIARIRDTFAPRPGRPVRRNDVSTFGSPRPAPKPGK